jgi:hypothetical protein
VEHHHHQPTTIAILGGADTVVENALAQLLEGEGYSTRVVKTSSMAEALVKKEMPLVGGGAALVVLAPSLSTSECEAFLAARRGTTPQRTTTTTTESSPIPVIVLCSPMNEAPHPLEEEEAVRSVPWPTSRERLVREIKDILDEVYLPPGYYLDRSDPEVLVLRRGEGSVVARFSAPGYLGESVEQEAWEDHRQRNIERRDPPPPR